MPFSAGLILIQTGETLLTPVIIFFFLLFLTKFKGVREGKTAVAHRKQWLQAMAAMDQSNKSMPVSYQSYNLVLLLHR
jgi:hypothetical protein